jgi:catechol 2,3-dioxygenase-like lactoylglutathione lyase family enzyme
MQNSEFSSPIYGVGVVVSDLQKSIEFYTEVIGMKVVREFSIDKEFGISSGLTGGIPFTVKVLQLEERPEANVWKLISFGKEAGHPKPEFIQDDTGMQYITLHVKRLAPFLDRIRKHGVKLLGKTPVPMDSERHFALVQDPDGTFIELIGPLEE